MMVWLFGKCQLYPIVSDCVQLSAPLKRQALFIMCTTCTSLKVMSIGFLVTLSKFVLTSQEHTQLLRIVNISPSSLRVSIIGPSLDCNALLRASHFIIWTIDQFYSFLIWIIWHDGCIWFLEIIVSASSHSRDCCQRSSNAMVQDQLR